MTRSLNVTPKTTEQHLTTAEANYWQAWSIARFVCDSRASCFVMLLIVPVWNYVHAVGRHAWLVMWAPLYVGCSVSLNILLTSNSRVNTIDLRRQLWAVSLLPAWIFCRALSVDRMKRFLTRPFYVRSSHASAALKSWKSRPPPSSDEIMILLTQRSCWF